MTDKLELKSSHEVVDTVNVADVESIFYCKPTDPDILTVLMKDGKRLYCDEVCPIDSLQENPVCAFSTNRYTDEDRKILCEGCEEDCKYNKKEEPASDSMEKELHSYIKSNFTIDKEQHESFGIEEKDYMYSMDESDMLKMIRNFTNNHKVPASNDLEEAAKLCVSDSLCITNEEDWDDAAVDALDIFKAGAIWQKEQMMKNSTEVTVHIDAGTYPYIPQMELYDYDKDVPLAKEGDKYKVVLIKEG